MKILLFYFYNILDSSSYSVICIFCLLWSIMYLQHWEFLINYQVFLSILNVLFYVRNPAFRLNCIQTETSCPQRWSIRILVRSRILARSYLWSIGGQIVPLTPLLYKTDRFHFAMHLFGIHHRWCQNMVRTPWNTWLLPLVPLFLSLPHFDVICDLLLKRTTVKMESVWFVQYTQNIPIRSSWVTLIALTLTYGIIGIL